MRLIYDVLIALLAAYGIIALVWLLLGTFGKRKGELVYAVVDADELDEQALRQTLSSINWLQQWGVIQLQPVIAASQYDGLLSKIALQHGGQLWVVGDGVPL